MHSQHPYADSLWQILLSSSIVVLTLTVLIVSKRATRKHGQARHYPPVVHISVRQGAYRDVRLLFIFLKADDIFNHPQEAYENALREHGPVVGVWRKGRLEYIVNQEYTRNVFLDKRMSFEQGVANILNFRRFVAANNISRFFSDLDKAVSDGIIPRLNIVARKIYPLFSKNAADLLESKHSAEDTTDIFAYTHRSTAEAMLVVILGNKYATSQNIDIVEDVSHALAKGAGIYQNVSFFARNFPGIWLFVTWAHIISFVLIPKYFWVLVPHMWREIRACRSTPLSRARKRDIHPDETLLQFMCRLYVQPNGQVSFLDTLWLVCIILGIIFASVHQTAAVSVWIIYELANKPSCMDVIREELDTVSGSDREGTPEALREARHLDSFIREVLRTKGDTLSIVRQTTEDVPVGNYIIPKGHLVCPLTTLSHRSEVIHGKSAKDFDGFRWVDTNHSASTMGLGYFPFGLGRWACPGRTLAITEIKMFIFSILAISTPRLKDGTYQIVDPLNVTSVPPIGNIVLDPIPSPNSDA